VLFTSLWVGAGCSKPHTRIELTSYDQSGQSQHHYAEFSRASYRQSPGGLIELVMQTERASKIDPTQTITQILYIKTFWNPRPGTTYVEATQIDGQVEYAMLTPPTGIRYDGSAFLTYHVDRNSHKFIGKFESGTLSPRYRMGAAVEPFGSVRFTGTIVAKENPGEVVNALQQLQIEFSDKIADQKTAGAHPGG
jgi:hypothetical protein